MSLEAILGKVKRGIAYSVIAAIGYFGLGCEVEDPFWTHRDAVTWNGHTYRCVKEHKTWYSAEQEAQKHDGHLISINSAKEFSVINHFYSFTQMAGIDNGIWTGLNDRDDYTSEGFPVNSDYSEVGYTPTFTVANHENLDAVAYHIYMNCPPYGACTPGGGWIWDSCSVQRSFICERDH